MTLNLEPWLNRLWITDKQANTIRFSPNWAQKQVINQVEETYNAGKPVRIIKLKARQLGMSTVDGALAFTFATLFDNTSAFIVAHTAGSTIYLFDKVRFLYDTWELKHHYPTRYSSRREMSFESNNSFIRVQTARSPDALRARTITFAHLSEVAFWERQEEAMLAVRSAVPNAPGTVMLLESTANGLGNWFEQTWQEAEQGKVDYVPMFFPWFTHYEYIPCHGITCRDATCEVCVKESAIRPFGEEEKRLIGLGCDLSHLAWRRWALPNLAFGSEDFFLQEFPPTASDAFMVSGVSVFPEIWLARIFDKSRPAVGRLVQAPDGSIEFVMDPQGPLRVYKPPAKDLSFGHYFLGADPCYGTVDGDLAAACVLNRQTKEQVAVWHGRMNPIPFADELVKLARWYNEAVISCEVDGPGQGTIARLVGLYNRIWHHRLMDRVPGRQRSDIVLGWQSNWKRKQWLVTQLADAVERQQITIHDRPTYNELRTYNFYGDRGDVFGPASGDQHDDLVMALGIAVVCERVESPIPPYETRPGPRGTDPEIVFGEKVELEELVSGEWA